jgi:hypothetical protein
MTDLKIKIFEALNSNHPQDNILKLILEEKIATADKYHTQVSRIFNDSNLPQQWTELAESANYIHGLHELKNEI